MSDFMDMKYQEALDRFKENNPGKTEEDFLKTIIRIPLEGGGSAKIIKFSDYKDPVKKVKELDLASMFTPGKTLAELSEKERDAVNTLLKLTFVPRLEWNRGKMHSNVKKRNSLIWFCE